MLTPTVEAAKNMRRHILLIAVAAFGGRVSPMRAADVSLPLVEYRALGAIGQVRITSGIVHDPSVQTDMLRHLALYDGKGLMLVAGDSARTSSHRERLGSHTVETMVRIYPATGRGYRGGLATADVVVSVDGVRRIDCPFTDSRVEIADMSIMPGDDMILVSGIVGGKHVDQVALLGAGQTIDERWLEEHAK